MSHYIHHVPGRLRVTSKRLRKNPLQAAELVKLINSQQGIFRCTVSTVTGSTLIFYDRGATDVQQLFGLLISHGYMEWQMAVGQSYLESDQGTPNIGELFVKSFAVAMAEKIMQRSARLIVGAFL